MRREQISNKEAVSLLTFFLMGSTLIIGVGGEAKKDAWIAGIVSIIISIPVILLYSRIQSLFPGRDIFSIIELSFGKMFGKVIGILYIWYAFHLGALVFRNIGEFLNIVAMPETPMLFTLLYLGTACIYAVRSGIEVMGRMSAYVLPVIMGIILFVNILTLPLYRINYAKPILEWGILPILKGAFTTFSFPFAESVLFIGVFYTLKTRKAPYRVYLSGVFIAGFVIVYLTFRNIAVLGDLRESLYFPSHIAVSRVAVGEFLQRIEVTVAIVLVASALLKATVCLFVSCKGIASIFKLKDYRSIVLQTGLLMVFFSSIIYDNVMEMEYWAFKVYAYYAFPFQVIIPVMLWIFAEIKARKMKETGKEEQTGK